MVVPFASAQAVGDVDGMWMMSQFLPLDNASRRSQTICNWTNTGASSSPIPIILGADVTRNRYVRENNDWTDLHPPDPTWPSYLDPLEEATFTDFVGAYLDGLTVSSGSTVTVTVVLEREFASMTWTSMLGGVDWSRHRLWESVVKRTWDLS